MKYLGKSKLAKLEGKEKGDFIEISDDADAILEEIKKGFEALRLSNIMRR